MIYNLFKCPIHKNLFRKPELVNEDYRRLYRLYRAAIKALSLLETER